MSARYWVACIIRLPGNIRAVLPLCGLVLIALVLAAYALTFPQLTGRVVDEAGILEPTAKAEVERKLAEFETKTTGQLVVVTLKSLQGTSIEDYGYQLGRHWGIGQKEKNSGALLIVVPSERKVRIEVGYGLEGQLTDAVSRLIIRTPSCRVLGQETTPAVSVAASMTSSRLWPIPTNGGSAPSSGRTASRSASISSWRYCS